VLVSHQTSANCTSSLPIHEQAWPIQMIKNGRIDGDNWLVEFATLMQLRCCAMPAKQFGYLGMTALQG
jgi:hypothetical protein